MAAKIEAFNPKTDALGKKTFEGLSFDDSPLGKRLNINLQKLSNSLDRRLSKIRKECRDEREGSGLRRSWREPDSRPDRGVEMEPSARQPVRAGSAAATGAGGGGPAPTHEAGVRVGPKSGATAWDVTGESWENPGNSGSMVDHVLAHGFAGAEGVRPADDGDAEGVEPGLEDDTADGTVVAADGENTATCGESLQVVELGENRENDTNEANFREDVITIQTPEDLGVTAELAVGAGLDSGVDRHAVSPDLVCPDSERESGEAVISDGGEPRTEAVGLSEGAGAGIGEGDVQAGPFVESRAVARMGVESVGRAGSCERGRRGAEPRGGAGGADREGIRVKTGEGPRHEAARLEREKSLIRRLFESSPDLVEMVRQQLPREP